MRDRCTAVASDLRLAGWQVAKSKLSSSSSFQQPLHGSASIPMSGEIPPGSPKQQPATAATTKPPYTVESAAFNTSREHVEAAGKAAQWDQGLC